MSRQLHGQKCRESGVCVQRSVPCTGLLPDSLVLIHKRQGQSKPMQWDLISDGWWLPAKPRATNAFSSCTPLGGQSDLGKECVLTLPLAVGGTCPHHPIRHQRQFGALKSEASNPTVFQPLCESWSHRWVHDCRSEGLHGTRASKKAN